jgi:polyisoprenoid-binding protein YceI
MKTIFSSLILLVFITIEAAGSTDRLPNLDVWEIDPEHSNVCFSIHHLGISEVMGFFKKFTGTMEATSDDFSDAKIQFSVDVNSIESNNEERNVHLKSNGFLYADQYPEMKFKSKSFKKQKGDNYKLSGELTIRDVTKNVTFDVEYLGAVTVTGIQKLAFKAETTINRFEYNIKWNTTTPDGIQIIDERVNISLNLEFSKGI